MNTIGKVIETSSAVQGAIPSAETSLRDSLAQVITTLSGRTVLGSELAHHQISEDVLFTAFVHEELKKSKPAVAQGLLEHLQKTVPRNIEIQRRQPVTTSVETYLANVTRSKKITSTQKDQIIRSSFSAAQLDNDNSTLRRNPLNLKVKESTVTTKSNVELILERSASNQTISRADLAAFHTKISNAPKLTDAQAAKQKNAFTNIFAPVVQTGPTTSVVTAPPVTTPAPPKVTEKDNPTIPNDAKTLTSGPNDLMYKPRSEKDGNALVQVPLLYSKTVKSVSMFNAQGERLFDLKLAGEGDDGRKHFRADHAGDKFEGRGEVILEFTDGTWINPATVDLKDPFIRSYN